MRIVLCIDDMPVRYQKLSRLLDGEEIVAVFTCRLEDFFQYLEGPHEIVGVCLDHDMPFQGGQWFARELSEKNYPICITSMNPDGAEKIKHILDEYETPNLVLPCAQDDWERKAMIFFGLWQEY